MFVIIFETFLSFRSINVVILAYNSIVFVFNLNGLIEHCILGIILRKVSYRSNNAFFQNFKNIMVEDKILYIFLLGEKSENRTQSIINTQ